MSGLVAVERPAAGAPDGLLILHHGRGADERNIIALADEVDPQRRLHAIAPRGPLVLDGWPGYHWYVVPRVGFPDPPTFHAAYAALADFHDRAWEATGIDPGRTVLGGFSMGSVMSYALGLGPDRPRPAGILALSGFIPAVDGWEPDLAARAGLPVLIAHGRRDQIMDVDFARTASARLADAGLDVGYLESDAAHAIDPAAIPEVRVWLGRTLPPTSA
jgi:phospholipase/carboxylesterase